MEQKNVVLVFTDQMRYDAIHAHGNPVIKTPVLDKLISNGVTFSKGYTPCPVCVPARYSMHTGKMPHHTGVFENNQMPNKFPSFMELLSEEGYQTFGTGKMHFSFETGLSTPWGFDKRSVCDEDENLDKNDFYQANKKAGYGYVHDYKGVKSEMYYIPQVSQLPAKLHHSTWTVDCSIDYLESRDKEKPFFLMTSFEKPHPPFEPPVPWNKLYRCADMTLPKRPENSEELMTLWNRFQNRYKYRDQGIDDNLIRTMKAHYYGEVSFLDYNLGRLLEYLDSQDILDSTLILFASDHGEFLGDYNCFGKRSFLDSSARVPIIMHHPSGNKGSEVSRPVSLIDIMPTILNFAGITSELKLDGEDLLSIANGTCKRDVVYGQYEEGNYANYMAMNGRYKYIYSAPDQKEFLYDLLTDPEETRNKANNPLFVKKTEEMREKTIQYFVDEGYTSEIVDGKWKPYPVKTMPSDPDAYLLFQDKEGSLPNIPGYTTDGNAKTYFEFKWYNE